MAHELILIVEDNDKNLKLVRDTLQVKGYQTVEAGTGEEGVRLARERGPALILMDIQLPGISGITAFRQLRDDAVQADRILKRFRGRFSGRRVPLRGAGVRGRIVLT